MKKPRRLFGFIKWVFKWSVISFVGLAIFNGMTMTAEDKARLDVARKAEQVAESEERLKKAQQAYTPPVFPSPAVPMQGQATKTVVLKYGKTKRMGKSHRR